MVSMVFWRPIPGIIAIFHQQFSSLNLFKEYIFTPRLSKPDALCGEQSSAFRWRRRCRKRSVLARNKYPLVIQKVDDDFIHHNADYLIITATGSCPFWSPIRAVFLTFRPSDFSPLTCNWLVGKSQEKTGVLTYNLHLTSLYRTLLFSRLDLLVFVYHHQYTILR